MTTQFRGLKPASALLPHLTEKVLGKQGLLFGKLIDHWLDIIVAELGLKATPISLKFIGKTSKNRNQAVLTLSATSSDAVELHYDLPLIIERINDFFGYEAVKSINIIHKTKNARTQKVKIKKTTALPAETREKINLLTSEITEKELKEALTDFGCSLAAQNKK